MAHGLEDDSAEVIFQPSFQVLKFRVLHRGHNDS